MDIKSVLIMDLLPDPSNARKHDEKNLRAIKGSLKKFGQQKPIVVGSDNVVIAGNGTLEAAKSLGWEKIDVVYSKLTGSEAIAFAIADNKTSELAEWDNEVLSKALDALLNEGFEVEEIGFGIDDVDKTQLISENKEYTADAFDNFQHQCPRCGFEFTDGKNTESPENGTVEPDGSF